MNKIYSLKEAAQAVEDGHMIALGGNTLHRIPAAFVRMLCLLNKKNLKAVKTAGAYDIDLLSACGCLSEVHAGYIGYENIGLALHYRKAVESGEVIAAEHACYSVIAGLRAAAFGVPFMPINGFQGSDVPRARGFRHLRNPYGEEEVLVIPALHPDFAVIHVNKCDKRGNAYIHGAPFEDILMSKAAKKVILTTEEIVENVPAEQVAIPHFMVDIVVQVPNGAWPCSCPGKYNADYGYLNAFRKYSKAEIQMHIKGVDTHE